MIYATVQLRQLTVVGETWKSSKEYVSAAERGQKPLSEKQALNILRYSLDTEAKRTDAIAAEVGLLVLLSAIAAVSVVTLVAGVRAVPRR